MSFVHLHTHSEYSLLDGASRISEMVRHAVETGMPAIALTDHGVLYGAVDLYLQSKAAGINPVIGQEAYVATRSRHQKEGRADRDPYHLILLVKNLAGYRNLIKLSSLAHLEGYYYKPRIDKGLLAEHAQGLIALSSCLGGEVASRLLEGDEAGAEHAALEYQRIFGEDFFLEIQDHGMEEQARVTEGLARLSQRTGIPLVATNDTHYTRKDDAEAHDILLCLQTGTVVSDTNRMRFHNDEFYLKTPAEMEERFRDFPEAVANTVRIAERCHLELETKPLLPRFEVPGGESAESYLRRLAEEGPRSHPRGGPCARCPATRGRPAGEARAAAAEHDARQGDADGSRAGGGGDRSGLRAAAEERAQARRPHPPCVDPCGGHRHHTGTAAALCPVAERHHPRRAQRPGKAGSDDPVRDERGPEDRPAQDGLPGPAQSFDHRRRAEESGADPRAQTGSHADPVGRPGDLQALAGGRYQRRLPARVGRAATAAPGHAADRLRGHHRGER